MTTSDKIHSDVVDTILQSRDMDGVDDGVLFTVPNSYDVTPVYVAVYVTTNEWCLGGDTFFLVDMVRRVIYPIGEAIILSGDPDDLPVRPYHDIVSEWAVKDSIIGE